MLKRTEFQPGFYLLDDGRVRQFLITGEAGSLLIDTGFPDTPLAGAVQQTAAGPVQVLLTHGDWDHTGNLAAFGACRAHPADREMLPGGIDCQPLREGDRFSCGGYELTVLEIPGHTPGSVAFWDERNGLLLPGDSVQQEGPVYLFGPHRDLDAYLKSLERLWQMRDAVRWILPCHHACPIGPEWIGRVLEDARALRAGRLAGERHPQLPCWIYRGKWTQFLGEAPEFYRR